MPTSFISLSMHLLQVSRGLPLPLEPCGFHWRACRVILFLPFLNVCPTHICLFPSVLVPVQFFPTAVHFLFYPSTLVSKFFLKIYWKTPGVWRSHNRRDFANDIALWQQNADVELAAENINRDLVVLQRYCERWKMLVNTQQTMCSDFANSGKGMGLLIRDKTLKMESWPGRVRPRAQWIPSHVAILGNEKADDFANKGRGGSQNVKPATLACCKMEAGRRMAELWAQALYRDGTCHSFSISIYLPPIRDRNTSKVNKKQVWRWQPKGWFETRSIENVDI